MSGRQCTRGVFKGDLSVYFEDLRKNCTPGSALIPPSPDQSLRVKWINKLLLSMCPRFLCLLADLQTVGDEIKLVG